MEYTKMNTYGDEVANECIEYCFECWEYIRLCACGRGYEDEYVFDESAELESELPEPVPDPLIGGLPPFDRRKKKRQTPPV